MRACVTLPYTCDIIAVLRSLSRSTSTLQWWRSSPGAWSKRQRCWRKSERSFPRIFQDCVCVRLGGWVSGWVDGQEGPWLWVVDLFCCFYFWPWCFHHSTICCCVRIGNTPLLYDPVAPPTPALSAVYLHHPTSKVFSAHPPFSPFKYPPCQQEFAFATLAFPPFYTNSPLRLIICYRQGRRVR